MRTKGLGVSLAELLPAGDICDEHTGAHHMFKAGAQLGEGAGDDLDAAASLRGRICWGNHIPIVVHWCGTADEDVIAHTQRPTIAYLCLPGSP